jgi:hypothetical protein
MQQSGASPTTPTSAASSIFVDANDALLLDEDEGIAKELAELKELQLSVRKNLLLRPLSTQNLRAAVSGPSTSTPSAPESVKSPNQIPGSYPFTPQVYTHQPPLSAASTASDVFYSARPQSTASFTAYYFEDPQLDGIKSPGSAAFMPPGSFPKTPFVSSESTYVRQVRDPFLGLPSTIEN